MASNNPPMYGPEDCTLSGFLYFKKFFGCGFKGIFNFVVFVFIAALVAWGITATIQVKQDADTLQQNAEQISQDAAQIALLNTMTGTPAPSTPIPTLASIMSVVLPSSTPAATTPGQTVIPVTGASIVGPPVGTLSPFTSTPLPTTIAPIPIVTPTPVVQVNGDNGSVPCNTYCGGTGGKPWNGELPASWNGAISAARSTNNTTDCWCSPTGTGWNN